MKTKHLVTLFSVFFLLSCNGPIVNRVTDNAIVTRDTGLLKVEFTKVYSGEQVNTLIRKVTAALPTCSSYSSSIYAYGFDSDYKEMEAIQESTVNIYGEAENEYGIAEAKITERHVNGGAFSVELSETIKEEFGRTNEGILLSKSVRTDYNGLTNTS